MVLNKLERIAVIYAKKVPGEEFLTASLA